MMVELGAQHMIYIEYCFIMQILVSGHIESYVPGPNHRARTMAQAEILGLTSCYLKSHMIYLYDTRNMLHTYMIDMSSGAWQ